MRSLFDAMRRHAERDGAALAASDPNGALSRRELLGRVSAFAREIDPGARIVGLLAANGIDWAVAQLACAMAGKIAVPLPTFFSAAQLAHIARDASIDLIVTTPEMEPSARSSGVATRLVGGRTGEALPFEPVDGFGQIIYTSGSTGEPKGVRHESGQIAWSSATLARATGAGEGDSYLSVLPLPLLLETICAVFIPALVGAPVHFDTALADGVGRGSAAGLAAAVEAMRPTMCVVVPQLLRSWVGELMAARRRAAASLRFVAAGGAPVPPPVAEAAWSLGIPVHEGYGLSECCSVVTVNRAGERRGGTVGRPLDGIGVTIVDGEIVVDSPSITDGYLGAGPAARPWLTGDLGGIDADGFLTVHGRKDNLLVTAFGRNVSPEWIETMLLGDPRIAFCAVLGHGEPALKALLVPTAGGAEWFERADEAAVLALLATCCAGAPQYAVPGAYAIVPLAEAVAGGLLASNGRIRRREAAKFFAALSPNGEALAV